MQAASTVQVYGHCMNGWMAFGQTELSTESRLIDRFQTYFRLVGRWVFIAYESYYV